MTAASDWEHRKYEPVRLPVTPVLAPETARALLRECVTIVSPGETLVIRVPEGWTAEQAEEYQRYVDLCGLPFRVLVVIGDELAVAVPGPGVSLDVKIAGIVPGEVDKALAAQMSKARDYVRTRHPRSA